MNQPKKNLITLVAATLIVAAIVILLWILRGKYTEPEQPKVVSQELEKLKDPNSSEKEVFYALTRLASNTETASKARAEALRRVNAEPLVQEAAADVLARFDDEDSRAALQTFLNSNQPAVRMRAIQGIGYIKSKEREKLLEDILPKLVGTERHAALNVLGVMTQSPSVKNRVIDELTVAAKSGTTQENITAALFLISIAPKAPETSRAVISLLEKIKNGQFVTSAISHLASMQDPWLKNRVHNYLTHEDANVRIAAIHSISTLCTPGAFDILKKVAHIEKDKRVLDEITVEMKILSDGNFCKKP